jgi:hypothetical protein
MILSEARGLTQERLKSLLDYDSSTGLFRRKVRTSYCRIGDIAGSRTANGYWVIWVDGTRRFAHRLAWLFTHGAWPREHLDHKNGVMTDNRIENLREATYSQNQANSKLRKMRRYKGVYLQKDGRRNPWEAQIRKDGKTHHLGHFATEFEAHQAYIGAAREMHGEFMRL